MYTATATQAAAASRRNVQLSVAANGVVRLNGEVVEPSDGRTTAVLRLMEKQAELRQQHAARTQLLAEVAAPGGGQDLDASLAAAKRRVALLEADKAKLDGTTMLSQSHSRRRALRRKELRAEVEHIEGAVEKIAARQKRMEKVVDKVKKVMRYNV
mmetsp:Transcript_9530/g.22425  ORF Transcript_9530/g.22425 Transcript_9530/m.22425 type:complete len:156 (-) Transcript_9530:79-546(-)